MTRLALVLISLLAVFGCAQRSEKGVSAAAMAPMEAPAAAPSANRYLAYEHTVSIDTDDDKVAPLFDAAQSACREAVADSCAILDARVTRSDASYASLRLRAKPAGIKTLLAILSGQGKVTSLATTAEDLAGPIEDTAKQLAMLTDYRSKLTKRNVDTSGLATFGWEPTKGH